MDLHGHHNAFRMRFFTKTKPFPYQSLAHTKIRWRTFFLIYFFLRFRFLKKRIDLCWQTHLDSGVPEYAIL